MEKNQSHKRTKRGNKKCEESAQEVSINKATTLPRIEGQRLET